MSCMQKYLLSFVALAAVASCKNNGEPYPASTVSSESSNTLLWEASASSCSLINTTTGPRYHLCNTGVSGSYGATVTQTNDVAIKELSYKTYLRLSFSCEALDSAVAPVKWNIAGVGSELQPSATAKVDGEFSVSYDQTPLKISYTPRGTTVFKPGCRLILEQNFKYPDPKIAKFYAKLLSQQQKALVDALSAVTANSDTVLVLSSMSNAIDTINEALSDYGDDLDADTKRDLEKAVVELTAAKNTVDGTCESTPGACSSAKQQAQDLLKSQVENGQKSIASLIDFLSKEVTRLESLNQEVTEKLKAALRIIQA